MIEYPITLRQLHVSRVADITSRIRRVTLTGEQLGALERDGIECPAFLTGAPDDHVRVLPPTAGPLVLPTQDHGHLDWPEDPPAVTRDYTVRRFDASTGQLDIEFVLDHDGPGARWAAEVEVGDPLHVAGPRSSVEHPADATSYLLVGDDAALPAIARFFDELPHPERARAIVVVDDVNASYPLPPGQTRWLVRPDSHADPADVHRLVREALDDDPHAYVWAALEYQTARDLRAVLRDAGVERDQSYVTHYWRRTALDEQGERAAAEARLRPMVDLLTPSVLRVAATIGLPDAVAAGADTVQTLAARTGCDADAVGILLDHLSARGVVRPLGDGTYRLTSVGDLLRRDDESGYHALLDLRLASGHMASALPGLLHAVETGRSGYEHVHGRTFWDAMSSAEDVGASFDDRLAEWAGQWAPAVTGLDVWPGVRRVVDVGGGSGVLAAALAEAHPHLAITLVELEGPAGRAAMMLADRDLEERVTVSTASFFDPLPAGADVYVLAQVLHDWPDADARRILGRCAEALPDGGRLLVVERLAGPEGGTEHAAMSVLMLALFGAKERSLGDYEVLLAAAGLDLVEVHRPPGALSVLEARSAGRRPPEPTVPEPTVPEPTDPEPTDPEPTDPEPTDPEPTDPEPTDPRDRGTS